MNDDKLKELIKNDHHVPETPLNEWSQIHSKLNPSGRGLSLKLMGSFACLLIIFFVTINSNNSNDPEELNEVVAEYVLDDIYFETEELYTWID